MHMSTQLVLQFDNADDLLRVLKLLRDNGLEKLAFAPKQQKKKPASPKSNWVFGLGNLHGGLDEVNIRDYAYED